MSYIAAHNRVGHLRSDETGSVRKTVGDAHQRPSEVWRHVDVGDHEAAVSAAVERHRGGKESDAERFIRKRHQNQQNARSEERY